jgi:hypothetical protein
MAAGVVLSSMPYAYSANTAPLSRKSPTDLVYLNVRGNQVTFSRELLSYTYAKNSPFKSFCESPMPASLESNGALFIDADARNFNYLLDILAGDLNIANLGSLSKALVIRHLAAKWLPSLALDIDQNYIKCHKDLKVEVNHSQTSGSLQWRFDGHHTNSLLVSSFVGPIDVAKFCHSEWNNRSRNLPYILMPIDTKNGTLPLQVQLYDLYRERGIGSRLEIKLNSTLLTEIGGLPANIVLFSIIISDSVSNHICWYVGGKQFGIYNLRTAKRVLDNQSFSLLSDCQKELAKMVDCDD